MRIQVVENSREVPRQRLAIKTAIDLAWSKGFPVYLVLEGKSIQVLPWDGSNDIEGKLEIGNRELQSL